MALVHRMAVITNYEHCVLQYEDLHAEITEIPDYKNTNDHNVFLGMKKRGDWTKRMRQLRLDIVSTRNRVTAYSVSDYCDRVA